MRDEFHKSKYTGFNKDYLDSYVKSTATFNFERKLYEKGEDYEGKKSQRGHEIPPERVKRAKFGSSSTTQSESGGSGIGKPIFFFSLVIFILWKVLT